MKIRMLNVKLLALIFGITLTVTVAGEERSYSPRDGFVPNEKTAIAIAEAILVPIYGQKQIESERPFHAKLNEKGIWTVAGSLPDGWDGGIAVVRIQRQDGRILYVMHGK